MEESVPAHARPRPHHAVIQSWSTVLETVRVTVAGVPRLGILVRAVGGTVYVCTPCPAHPVKREWGLTNDSGSARVKTIEAGHRGGNEERTEGCGG